MIFDGEKWNILVVSSELTVLLQTLQRMFRNFSGL